MSERRQKKQSNTKHVLKRWKWYVKKESMSGNKADR